MTARDASSATSRGFPRGASLTRNPPPRVTGLDQRRTLRSVTFERITLEAGKMGGQPCIRGLRIPVTTVVAMVADGMTADEIVTQLPDLEPEDVAEALRYASEALRERQLPLRQPA